MQSILPPAPDRTPAQENPAPPRPRRRGAQYDPAFRQRALTKLASGLPLKRVARLMDVPAPTLLRWRQQTPPLPSPLPAPGCCHPRSLSGLGSVVTTPTPDKPTAAYGL